MLRAGEIGDAKAFAIGAGCQSGRALEQAPEEGRVLVADLPADLVDGRVRPLEPALCIFDPQALDVGDRGVVERLEAGITVADVGCGDGHSTLLFDVARATDYPGEGYRLICFFDALHDMGDPIAAVRHAARCLAPDGTVMLIEPFANDRVEDNISPVARLFYCASTALCCANAIADGGHLVLGAQAGEARLAEVFRKAGFTHFRRAAETPFNLILEARR